MNLALPRFIGHRGAAGLAPENTGASFLIAAKAGCAWIELDVRLTADGQTVVFHDEELGRTTNGHGPVIKKTLAAIKALDAGLWFAPEFANERIMTLTEALGMVAALGLGVNIELKPFKDREADLARRALSEALAIWPGDLPIPLISSFSRKALAHARDILPEWPRGLLAERLPLDWRDQEAELGLSSLHLDWRQVDAETARHAKNSGLSLLAYTVNAPETAQALWEMGVDSLFTDRPDLLGHSASDKG